MYSESTTTQIQHDAWSTRIVVGLLAMVAFSASAFADPKIAAPVEYRLVTSAGKFQDTHQFAAAYRLRSPRPLRAHHLELAVGTLYGTDEAEAFVSLGPVWRFPVNDDGSTFVDFGWSPTLLSGSTFDGRELGGNFHFTSSLAIGTRFGRAEKYSLSLRAQHTSNGGLHSENPGIDMVGLTFAVEFRD